VTVGSRVEWFRKIGRGLFAEGGIIEAYVFLACTPGRGADNYSVSSEVGQTELRTLNVRNAW
jgi:hypothetical protein